MRAFLWGFFLVRCEGLRKEGVMFCTHSKAPIRPMCDIRLYTLNVIDMCKWAKLNSHSASVESTHREDFWGFSFQAHKPCSVCEDQHEDGVQQLWSGLCQNMGHGERIAAQGETYKRHIFNLCQTVFQQHLVIHICLLLFFYLGDWCPQELSEVPVLRRMAFFIWRHQWAGHGLEFKLWR